jgi:hypothetical protein
VKTILDIKAPAKADALTRALIAIATKAAMEDAEINAPSKKATNSPSDVLLPRPARRV